MAQSNVLLFCTKCAATTRAGQPLTTACPLNGPAHAFSPLSANTSLAKPAPTLNRPPSITTSSPTPDYSVEEFFPEKPRRSPSARTNTTSRTSSSVGARPKSTRVRGNVSAFDFDDTNTTTGARRGRQAPRTPKPRSRSAMKKQSQTPRAKKKVAFGPTKRSTKKTNNKLANFLKLNQCHDPVLMESLKLINVTDYEDISTITRDELEQLLRIFETEASQRDAVVRPIVRRFRKIWRAESRADKEGTPTTPKSSRKPNSTSLAPLAGLGRSQSSASLLGHRSMHSVESVLSTSSSRTDHSAFSPTRSPPSEIPQTETKVEDEIDERKIVDDESPNTPEEIAWNDSSPFSRDGYELHRFLQDHDIFHMDLLQLLIDNDINQPEDFAILRAREFKSIRRQMKLKQTDPQQQAFVEGILERFETVWREKSGSIREVRTPRNQTRGRPRSATFQVDGDSHPIRRGRSEIVRRDRSPTRSPSRSRSRARSTSRTRSTSRARSTTRQRQDRYEEHSLSRESSLSSLGLGPSMAQEAPDLRKWMKQGQVWQKTLFELLYQEGCRTRNDVALLTDRELTNVIRRARVERMANLRDNKSRERMDKLLANFEKMYKLQVKRNGFD